MVLPMGIATFLRIVLYIVLFGIVADLLNETESLVAIDNVFWIIVTYAAFDCGPMILLTIDWWYYYVQKDFNGLFGTWANPMRCVVGQSGVLFVASWSFIAIFEQYADDAAEYIWPWILHGVVSTAVLIFCCIVQFSGMYHVVSTVVIYYVCKQTTVNDFPHFETVHILNICGFFSLRALHIFVVHFIYFMYSSHFAKRNLLLISLHLCGCLFHFVFIRNRDWK